MPPKVSHQSRRYVTRDPFRDVSDIETPCGGTSSKKFSGMLFEQNCRQLVPQSPTLSVGVTHFTISRFTFSRFTFSMKRSQNGRLKPCLATGPASENWM
jgi:hypothetical protein